MQQRPPSRGICADICAGGSGKHRLYLDVQLARLSMVVTAQRFPYAWLMR
jgi:hypothetical protein